MKYIILVPDGLADEPVEALGRKTPLEAADTPNMDYLAQHGFSGLVKTIPDSLPPGSDIGNLALLGYDPTKDFSGRAPLEAASLGIDIKNDEVVFRCNLVTVKDDVMIDYSAGHIETPQAKDLIDHIQGLHGCPNIRFYAGKSYRHLMVVQSQNIKRLLEIKTTPPHDIIGQKIEQYLPAGSDTLSKIMEQSKTWLLDHPVNKKREAEGQEPANMIWLWGQGSRPTLPLFKDRYVLTGGIVSAVDLVNGIGRLIGLEIIDVPGATGYYDTNYKGKAEYALDCLKKHNFVYVHVEATDEAGHNGDWKAKKECCERFDKEVVGTILKEYREAKGVRILVAPDHPTPVSLRTHTRHPVPFVMWGDGIKATGLNNYSEKSATAAGLKFKSGEELVRYFFSSSVMTSSSSVIASNSECPS